MLNGSSGVGSAPHAVVFAKAEGANCGACPLRDRPFVPCHKIGIGRVAIVGEAPGATEVIKKAPFVGPSGNLLTKTLEATGVLSEICLVTNAVSCRPTDNETPTEQAIAACRPRLVRELQESGADTILLLGATSLLSLTGAKGITKERGRHLSGHTSQGLSNMTLVPTYHPAAVLRRRDLFPDFASDIQNCLKEPELVLGDVSYVVASPTTIDRIVDKLMCEPVVAIDIETSGFNWSDRTLCISAAWSTNKAVVIPEDLVNHPRVAELLSQHKGLLTHNGKFDALFLWHATGVRMHIGEDTLLAHYALDERVGTHGLKQLVTTTFNIPDWETELFKYLKRKSDSFENIPRPVLHKYGAKDAAYTYALHQVLHAKLLQEPSCMRIYRRSIDHANTLLQVEHHGMFVSREKLQAAHEDFLRLLIALQRELDGIQKGININSPVQLAGFLFGKLGLPRIQGNSTKAEVLDELLLRYPDNRAIAIIDEFRHVQKLLSSYIENIEALLDENDRVHPSFQLHGSVCVTGDTLIWTRQGMIRADNLAASAGDIAPGTFVPFDAEVYGLNGWEHTSHLLVTPNRETVTVTTLYNFKLRCTPEHPFLVYGKGWVNAGNLNKGDQVRLSWRADFKGMQRPLADEEMQTDLSSVTQPLLDANTTWLKAVTDTHGMISYRGTVLQVQYSCFTEEFARALQQALQAHGVLARIQRASWMYRGSEHIRFYVIIRGLFARRLCSIVGFCDPVWNGDDLPIDTGAFRIEDDGAWVSVSSVVPSEPTTVYDFTVPGTSSFTAAGLLVHNTGRLATSRPNLLNIPRTTSGSQSHRIKELFVAPPGYKIMVADYSQAELRVLATLSRDSFLIETYRNGGDIHNEAGRWIFALEEGQKLAKEQRMTAKMFVFGLVYGRTPISIALERKIPLSEATYLYNRFFERIPEARAWIEKTRQEALSTGSVETLTGRQRRFSLITRDSIGNVSNQAANFPMQSLSTEITLEAVRLLVNDPRLHDIAFPTLLVHDSIVLEVLATEVEKVESIVRETMLTAPYAILESDIVPFVVDVDVDDSWH
jgi:uracil-DNA glycosylase family 4